MALEPVQSGANPLGQFDGADDVYLTVKGGEVATIVGASKVGGDLAAADADDGYAQDGLNLGGEDRPVVTTDLTLASVDSPLYLVDEGISGYGTIFGSIVGGVAGQLTSGQVLGPHTATGSGKLTIWDKPGTYAVTLDAVDTTSGTGLTVDNTTLVIGANLFATDAGLLTPDAGSQYAARTVASFINFEQTKGGSLVTTPVSLVSAPNSPVGQGQPQAQAMSRALISFRP